MIILMDWMDVDSCQRASKTSTFACFLSRHTVWLPWKVVERLMMTMKMQLLLPCLLQVQETSIL